METKKFTFNEKIMKKKNLLMVTIIAVGLVYFTSCSKAEECYCTINGVTSTEGITSSDKPLDEGECDAADAAAKAQGTGECHMK